MTTFLDAEEAYREANELHAQYLAKMDEFRGLLVAALDDPEVTRAEMWKRLGISSARFYQLIDEFNAGQVKKGRKRRGGKGPRAKGNADLKIYESWRDR